MSSASSNLARELRFYSGLGRMLWRIRKAKPDARGTVADTLERQARRRPSAEAICFEDRSISYREWNDAANRVARWALRQGVERGDVVAILMENRPEFLFAWAGLAKIGAVAALFNTNLSGAALAHSLAASGAKHVITGADLCELLAAALPSGGAQHSIWIWGGERHGMHTLDPELARDNLPITRKDRAGLKGSHTCFLVFTSGTTGLPKAARISHARALMMMNAFSALGAADKSSRIYIPLPLYHTSGGICAVGAVLTVGGTIILKQKFSAQSFWSDCKKHRATHFIYIGELCRYLLNSPPHEDERAHKLKGAIGNGLRPEIWQAFQARFRVPHIWEFYGATEGNVSLFNFDGRAGAVGRIPPAIKKHLHVRLAAFDLTTGEIARDDMGRVREALPGEIGEAIGRIDERQTRARFEGYTGASDTERKILRDAFAPGDRWFRTGDLLRQDTDGYFYFVDRVGDTFRWKGENVATSEVAQVLSVIPGIKEANVYGVAVPGHEGKAGMAALETHGELDMDKLADTLVAALASYARPVFLRLKSDMEKTATFKQKKTELVREGFDPGAIKDPLFVAEGDKWRYVALDDTLYKAIVEGQVRL